MPTFDHEKDVAIFVHLPKTAGTTLQHVLWRHYAHEEMFFASEVPKPRQYLADMPPDSRRRLRLITGHITYGLHTAVQRGTGYFTMLRDPVELVLSYYHYLRRRPNHPHHHLVKPGGMSLSEFIAARVDENVHNIQTRRIGGIALGALDHVCSTHDLDAALTNLRDRFVGFGLTEHYDASMLLLAPLFGWHDLYYAPVNTTGRRPHRADLDSHTLAAVEAANAHDVELYAAAKALFAQRVAERGSAFERQVRRFRAQNRLRAPFISAYWRARRQMIDARRRLKRTK